MTIPRDRLSSGIGRHAHQPREDLFRLRAGRSNIEGVSAQVDFTGPNDCTALANGHSVEGIPVKPSLKDASASQIAEIHDAFDAIFVFPPQAESVPGALLELLSSTEASAAASSAWSARSTGRVVPIAWVSIRLSLHVHSRSQFPSAVSGCRGPALDQRVECWHGKRENLAAALPTRSAPLGVFAPRCTNRLER